MALLADGLPSDPAEWRIRGDLNNIRISANRVEIKPFSQQRTYVQKDLKLESSFQRPQYLSIVGVLRLVCRC